MGLHSHESYEKGTGYKEQNPSDSVWRKRIYKHSKVKVKGKVVPVL
jgi:hypothetical protein